MTERLVTRTDRFMANLTLSILEADKPSPIITGALLGLAAFHYIDPSYTIISKEAVFISLGAGTMSFGGDIATMIRRAAMEYLAKALK